VADAASPKNMAKYFNPLSIAASLHYIVKPKILDSIPLLDIGK